MSDLRLGKQCNARVVLLTESRTAKYSVYAVAARIAIPKNLLSLQFVNLVICGVSTTHNIRLVVRYGAPLYLVRGITGHVIVSRLRL